jgi:hypothetical protein
MAFSAAQAETEVIIQNMLSIGCLTAPLFAKQLAREGGQAA